MFHLNNNLHTGIMLWQSERNNIQSNINNKKTKKNDGIPFAIPPTPSFFSHIQFICLLLRSVFEEIFILLCCYFFAFLSLCLSIIIFFQILLFDSLFFCLQTNDYRFGNVVFSHISLILNGDNLCLFHIS